MFETLADTPERAEIRDAVRAICNKFDDTYWAEKDRTHSFPFEFAKPSPTAVGSALRCRSNTAGQGWE